MADEQGTGSDLPPDGVSAIRRAARMLDPSCSDEAIRRYEREIAEAETALAGVALDDADPGAAFSPIWTDELMR